MALTSLSRFNGVSVYQEEDRTAVFNQTIEVT